MKLTKEQMKEAILRLYGLLCDGTDETDVLDEMGLNAEEYEKLKHRMFEVKSAELQSTPPEHFYIQYIIDQTKNIKDLTDIVDQFKDTRQPTALVGAIRVRAEILDKIIAKGQEFGILKKTPNRTEIVAGVAIAELSDGDLKKQILNSIGSLGTLLGKYGDKDILDVSPGILHSGPALPEAVLAGDAIKVKRIESPRKGRRDKVRLGRKKQS